MNDECLICKAQLEYIYKDEIMECEICRKKQNSKAKCKNGHFVCDECHSVGMDGIISICLNSKSTNPVEILETMMHMPTCHMHGPEHHIMVGSALLSAYKNAGGDINLNDALIEMQMRGKQVPGGVCGFWGACGAGISAGMFMSIIMKSSPLAKEEWSLSNEMTSRALGAISKHGGPRCCKRDSYIAIKEAVDFTSEKLGIKMQIDRIVCSRSHLNNQCLQKECPFYAVKKKVAFICVHNSCRSQIAEALGKYLASDVFESYSAGTQTKPEINQDAVRIMKEMYGIDMEKSQYSKLTTEIPDPDIAISMGCNVGCPFFERGFDDNWGLDDPTGKSDDDYRLIIREIEERILQLKAKLEIDTYK